MPPRPQAKLHRQTRLLEQQMCGGVRHLVFFFVLSACAWCLLIDVVVFMKETMSYVRQK